jgi:hypothetical protein
MMDRITRTKKDVENNSHILPRSELAKQLFIVIVVVVVVVVVIRYQNNF